MNKRVIYPNNRSFQKDETGMMTCKKNTWTLVSCNDETQKNLNRRQENRRQKQGQGIKIKVDSDNVVWVLRDSTQY